MPGRGFLPYVAVSIAAVQRARPEVTVDRTQEPAIRLESIHKSFGDNPVLRDIDLTVAAGEVLTIIGPSGSGKSTLLRCVNLLERLDSGSIWLEGEEITRRGVDVPRVRQSIGMVFQKIHLFPHLPGPGTSRSPPRVTNGGARRARREPRELLERVGVLDRSRAAPQKLSGGQQQRVAIARTLATDPEMILLDEITSALDPHLVGEVARRGCATWPATETTMLLVTHEMAFAREVATRAVFLDAGQVVEQGPPDVLDRPREERTRRFLRRSLQLARSLAQLPITDMEGEQPVRRLGLCCLPWRESPRQAPSQPWAPPHRTGARAQSRPRPSCRGSPRCLPTSPRASAG